jgi:hypothetical protein
MLFLLDTNIYLQMLREARDEYALSTLESVLEDEKITLLVPSVLLNEWNRKKEQTVKNLQSKINEAASITGHSDHIGISIEQLKERANRIDVLLTKGVAIKLTKEVKALIIDLSLSKKAPFHADKTKSINDALFFFSVTLYLRKKKSEKFYFITSDRDFTDPSSQEGILHPELVQPDINIVLYTSLSNCLNELQRRFGNTGGNTEKNFNYLLRVVKRKDNLLDYVYDVLFFLKTHLEFTPTDLIARIEPFRIRDIREPYSYYNNYSLVTNNEKLIDLFQSIDFSKALRFKPKTLYRNTKVNLEKLRFVVSALAHNLIHEIASRRGKGAVRIAHSDNKICNCVACTMGRLEIRNALLLLSDPNNDDDKVKKARALFDIGLYEKSFLRFNEDYQEKIKSSSRVQSYVALFRLKWSNNVSWHSENVEVQKLKQETNSLDTETEFFKFIASPDFEKQAAGLFFQNSKLRSYAETIIESLDSIRSHYRIQLNGGNSSNDNLRTLINRFQELEEFISQNKLPYTRFSDFETICTNYTEGLFLCLALNKEQSSRLEALHSGLMKQLLFRSSTDAMIGNYNRYIQKQITYHTSPDSTPFEDCVMNYLTDHKRAYSVITGINEKLWEIRDRYFSFFWNIIVLLSLVDVPETFLRQAAGKILAFLPDISNQEYRKVQLLGNFIKIKGKILGKSWLKPALNLILDNAELQHYEIFSAFFELADDNTFILISDEKTYEKTVSLFGDKEKLLDKYNDVTLFDLSKVMSAKFRKQFADYVRSILQTEFNGILFYKACMYNVLEAKEFFDQYLASYPRPEKASLNRNYLFRETRTLPYVNEIINLSLKFNIILPIEFVERFKGLSDYYDWLLDMDTFNYALFDPLWILQYDSFYFYRKAFSKKAVIEAVRSFLRNNPQPKLARQFALHTHQG